jgi:hypothetical protein
MKNDLEGFDESIGQIKDLEQKRNNLNEEHDVPLEEIYSLEFMSKYTDFGSFKEMLESSGFTIKTKEDLINIPSYDWDSFISKRTRFAKWIDMHSAAVTEYNIRNMKQKGIA